MIKRAWAALKARRAERTRRKRVQALSMHVEQMRELTAWAQAQRVAAMDLLAAELVDGKGRA